MQHRHNNFQKKKKIATYLVYAAVGLCLGIGVIGYPKVASFIERMKIEEENKVTIDYIMASNIVEETVESIGEIAAGEEVEDEEIVILENAYLEVPFVCQAPFETSANWEYHEESCEEAALLQVKYYMDGVVNVDKQKAHETLLDMIEWQKENFGEHRDIYANDMKLFIRDYYGFEDEDIKIIYDAGLEDIKKAVSSGYPVIVPIMGDILQNPYYPYPGYHMLTVIGYTPDKIITNDVGTKRGKDFSYDNERFLRAMDAAGGDILFIKKQPDSASVKAEE